MDIFTILIISFGLAMDAFAVSITNGFVLKKIGFKEIFSISLTFGIFQGIMPIVGWIVGLSFKEYIQSYDHWIALALLSFIGIKMIYESKQIDKIESQDAYCSTLSGLIVMAIATSIDALAVGVSFSCLNVSIYTPAIIIGIITFILCFLGVFIGKKLGHLFENKLELIGGIILIIIGIKIVIEHLIKGI